MSVHPNLCVEVIPFGQSLPSFLSAVNEEHEVGGFMTGREVRVRSTRCIQDENEQDDSAPPTDFTFSVRVVRLHYFPFATEHARASATGTSGGRSSASSSAIGRAEMTLALPKERCERRPLQAPLSDV